MVRKPTWKSVRRVALRVILVLCIATLVAYAVQLKRVHDARTAFESDLTAHQRLGEPVFAEDFQVPPASNPTNNPAKYWKEALLSLDRYSISYMPSIFDEPQPLMLPFIERLRRVDQASLDAVEQAMKCGERADWPSVVVDAASFENESSYAIWELQELLSIDVRYSAYCGDYPRVFERLAQLHRLSLDLDSSIFGPCDLWHWTRATELIAIQIARDPQIRSGIRVFPEKECAGLIRELLDDAAMFKSDRRTLLCQRSWFLNSLLSVNGLELSHTGLERSVRLADWLQLPGSFRTATQLLAFHDKLTLSFYRPDYEGFLQSCPKPQWLSGEPLRMTSLEEHLLSFPAMHYNAETDRHLAAMTVAMEWYAAEHGGTFPQSPLELIPKYLPEMPGDSSTDGSPLQFRNDERAVIFSTRWWGSTRVATAVDREDPFYELDDTHVFLSSRH